MKLKEQEKELLLQELKASRQLEKFLLDQMMITFQVDRETMRNEINQLQQELQQRNQEVYKLKIDTAKVKHDYHLAITLLGILLLSGVMFSLTQ